MHIKGKHSFLHAEELGCFFVFGDGLSVPNTVFLIAVLF